MLGIFTLPTLTEGGQAAPETGCSDDNLCLRQRRTPAEACPVSCYVDAVRPYPEKGWRYTHFCHLLADTRAELHAMAGELGVPRRIFQDHLWRWHYDLPEHLRAQALTLGALELDMHQVGALLRQRRAQSPAARRRS